MSEPTWTRQEVLEILNRIGNKVDEHDGFSRYVESIEVAICSRVPTFPAAGVSPKAEAELTRLKEAGGELPDWVEDLYEQSKFNDIIIAGSDVRRLVGEIRSAQSRGALPVSAETLSPLTGALTFRERAKAVDIEEEWEPEQLAVAVVERERQLLAAQARIAALEEQVSEYLTLLKAARLAIKELTEIVNVTLPGIQAEHAELTAKYTIAQAEIDRLRGVPNVKN